MLEAEVAINLSKEEILQPAVRTLKTVIMRQQALGQTTCNEGQLEFSLLELYGNRDGVQGVTEQDFEGCAIGNRCDYRFTGLANSQW